MRGIRLPIIPVGGLNAWSCTLFRTLCSSKINTNNSSNNTKEAVPQSYNDAYRQLQNLDFMTAAKILFTSPSKEKKFGCVNSQKPMNQCLFSSCSASLTDSRSNRCSHFSSISDMRILNFALEEIGKFEIMPNCLYFN